MTTDLLPDVVLLEIFGLYLQEAASRTAWHTLVHVCRKWRAVVFGSPRRLRLRLHCKASTPVRETLGVWPQLPIAIWNNGYEKWGVGNIIAALGHNNRICRITLPDIPNPQVLAAMRQPFPALTHLRLQTENGTTPICSDSFLGGSSPPRLRSLFLDCIPIPGLPNLLLFATELVDLELWRIPHAGYFSPEALATCLSVLTRLKKLVIRFESPQSRPDPKLRRTHPQTRTLLPVLTHLEFKGVDEYLEDLVARIDAPLLDKLDIVFFHQLMFNTPQLALFISRTPKLKTHDGAHVFFFNKSVLVSLPQTFSGSLNLAILCSQSDWQLSSLAQVCSSSFQQVLVPAVEHLYIHEDGCAQLRWQDDIESSQWLELLHPFTAVKDLHISLGFVQRIASSLQELAQEGVTEVLPTLQSIFLEKILPSGPVQEAIGRFVAARQLVSHPVAVSRWEKKVGLSTYFPFYDWLHLLNSRPSS